MSKKIFISQSELDNGRNRNIRRLDAILDNNQQQVNSFETLYPFSSVDTREGFGSSVSSESPPLTPSLVYCPYTSDCGKKATDCSDYLNRNCYKFYKRYGYFWREMYIGSKL